MDSRCLLRVGILVSEEPCFHAVSFFADLLFHFAAVGADKSRRGGKVLGTKRRIGAQQRLFADSQMPLLLKNPPRFACARCTARPQTPGVDSTPGKASSRPCTTAGNNQAFFHPH
jgi:hypothetical protein